MADNIAADLRVTKDTDYFLAPGTGASCHKMLRLWTPQPAQVAYWGDRGDGAASHEANPR